jgi:hypothetical protein
MVKLHSHVESLLKGNLEETYSFFKTNMSNKTMKAQLTSFGSREFTVDGYEGSMKISHAAKILLQAGIDCVKLEEDAGQRIAGTQLASRIKFLNSRANIELQTASIWTRIGTMDWMPARISTDNTLTNCIRTFSTYNSAQFQKEFPDVDIASVPDVSMASKEPIQKIQTHFKTMYTINPASKERPLDSFVDLSRFIDKDTGLVVEADEVVEEQNLRKASSSEEPEQYKGFLVSTKLIKEKLNATQQALFCVETTLNSQAIEE